MRRLALLVLPAILSIILAGCRDELPTTVARRPAITPRHTLVNGPLTPINGGLVTSPVVAVETPPAGQTEPHVSGDLACYQHGVTGGSVHYFRFSSGVSSSIPVVAGTIDNSCTINGNHIVFTRVNGFSGLGALMLFDVSSAAVTPLDPQPGFHRWFPQIGTNTVAFTDVHDGNSNDIRVVDLATPNQSLLISGTGLDRAPNISLDDNAIVWNRCPDPNSCDVYKSLRAGGTWGAPVAVTSGGHGYNPDTDGSYIVYGVESPSTTGSDVFIQSVAGGPITQLAFAGADYDQRISAGVMTFVHQDAVGSLGDVFVYVVATNALFRITSSPTVLKFSPDVDVLPNGDIRVVWVAMSSPYVASDVYATTFTPVVPAFAFGGFLPPVQNLPTVNVVKAGAGIPVKFSLGGDRGLNVLAAGSPSSVQTTCDAGAPTGAVEETVTAGSSSFSYDATSDVYSYIWKTEKAWANSCRRLTLRFVDGTIQAADFQFTR
jgi:hypothetical protein